MTADSVTPEQTARMCRSMLNLEIPQGLFCQMEVCLLNPCRHDSCNISQNGTECSCNRSYFDSKCAIRTEECRMRHCFGNGNCHKFNETDIGCLCDSNWSGHRCEEFMDARMETLTIGQKLLKEPIWIGMIVIVNLVLFFCISYVIRRKCGKRLQMMLPKAKTSSQANKETSKEDSSARNTDIYCLPIWDVKESRPTSQIRQLDLHNNQNLKDSTAPTTPEVNDVNRDAALKMFASYKAKKAPKFVSFDEAIADARKAGSYGYATGTVSFEELDEVEGDSEQSLGYLRPYTITAGIDGAKRDKDVSSTRKSPRRSLNHSSELRAKPWSKTKDHSNSSQSNGSPALVHCYPSIQIMNESLCDDSTKTSDSEMSVAERMDTGKAQDSLEVPVEVHYQVVSETNDSGCPSTLSSSVTTDSVKSASDYLKRKYAPAVFKRKLFASKSKSLSFYNIGATSSPARTESVHSNGSIENYPKLSDDIKSSGTNLIKVDSCHSCSQKLKETRSYETALNKLSRTKNSCSSCTHSCPQRRSRHCKCVSRQNECRQHCRRHQRSSDYRSSRCYNDYSKYSSTESDTCTCICKRRKKNNFYRSKAFVSDGSFHSLSNLESDKQQKPRCSKHSRHRVTSGLDDISPSYKKSMMNSFLSDTCNASFSNLDLNADNDVSEVFGINVPKLDTNGVMTSHKQSIVSRTASLTSIEVTGNDAVFTRSISCANGGDGSRTRSSETVSTMSSNERLDRTRSRQRCDSTPRKARLKKKCSDSAYQTNQSSLDMSKVSLYQGYLDSFSQGEDDHQDVETESNQRPDDNVRHHLQKVALKLAMIKRMSGKQELSRDSAMNTFSEDDVSLDDTENRRSVERLLSNPSLLAKMSGLSQVKEELSVIISKESDSYSTPTNEKASIEKPEVVSQDRSDALPMTILSKYFTQTIENMEETHV